MNDFASPAPRAFDSSSSFERRLAYGLHFHSDFALPELPPDESATKADVVIALGPTLSRTEVARLIAPDSPIENVLRFEEGECQILFSDVGRYTLRAGQHVLVEPLEGTTESSWRLPLLGSVMALLLEQRGCFALHGGAARFLNRDGKEVAAGFLGDKGQGKSTLNAALSQAGFALLCDDVLAVSGLDSPAHSPGSHGPHSLDEQAEPMALSGFAWLKLAPDAVRDVWKKAPEEFALVAPEVADTDKRSIPARLAPESLPLRQLFILATLPEGVSEAIRLRRLSAPEALVALMPHTFAARFGALYLKGARRTTHFRASARLASECAVWELARKRDLTLLPQTLRIIEDAVCGEVTDSKSASSSDATARGSAHLSANATNFSSFNATDSGSVPLHTAQEVRDAS